MRIDELLKNPESLSKSYRTLLRDVEFQLHDTSLLAVCRNHLEAELIRVVVGVQIRDSAEKELGIQNVEASVSQPANKSPRSDLDVSVFASGPGTRHPEYVLGNFLANETNAAAFAAAIALVNRDSSGARKTDFLYIYGSEGCGKTHLLQAMVNELAARGKYLAVFDGQQFANYLITAASLTGQARDAHMRLLREADGLALDDIGPITGNGMQTVQEEFASILDGLDQNGKYGIFTGRYSLTGWRWKLADGLSAQLTKGQSAEIAAPKTSMRRMLAEMCFERSNLRPGQDVISFVGDADITSIRTLLTLCYQLVAQAYGGGDVTVRSAKSLLRKLGVKKGASNEKVVTSALQAMNVPILLSDMKGRTINRDLKRIRNQVIMRLVEGKKLSQSLIAGAFGISVQSVSKIVKEGKKH